MREQELAELLMRMAAERGIDVEPAAEELAGITLPSFVDRRTFRSAVVQALEAHLRIQMEQRLESIRRRFDVDAGAAVSQPTPVQSRPTPPPMQMAGTANQAAKDGFGDVADATVTDLPTIASDQPGDTSVEMDDMPADATMVWTTRHG